MKGKRIEMLAVIRYSMLVREIAVAIGIDVGCIMIRRVFEDKDAEDIVLFAIKIEVGDPVLKALLIQCGIIVLAVSRMWVNGIHSVQDNFSVHSQLIPYSLHEHVWHIARPGDIAHV